MFFVCSRSWDSAGLGGLDSEFWDLVWQLNRTCGSHLVSLSHFPLSWRNGWVRVWVAVEAGEWGIYIPSHKSHNFCMKLSCAMARLYCRQSTRDSTRDLFVVVVVSPLLYMYKFQPECLNKVSSWPCQDRDSRQRGERRMLC